MRTLTLCYLLISIFRQLNDEAFHFFIYLPFLQPSSHTTKEIPKDQSSLLYTYYTLEGIYHNTPIYTEQTPSVNIESFLEFHRFLAVLRTVALQ